MGNQKNLTIADQMERIHANASNALSNLPDRDEFCCFYTACVIDAEAQKDESYTLSFLFNAEGRKDMGTDDPTDDIFISLHDISSHPDFSVEDFKAEIQKIIEMYGEDEVFPIIPEEYLDEYNMPEEYSFEDLYEIIDDVIETGDWSLGGGFGIYIIGRIR